MTALKPDDRWAAWVAALAKPPHARLAWRLPDVVAGILQAPGRRTASRWWAAAGIGQGFRSHYYFLDSIGRRTRPVAAALLKIVPERVQGGHLLAFDPDDTPTERSGPEVQGAGIHHNPTPGPAGSKFLYGHSRVTPSRVAHHARQRVIGLPPLAMLHVRKAGIPALPPEAGIAFSTKFRTATGIMGWPADQLPEAELRRCRLAVDGGHAKRDPLKPAIGARLTVVARLRKDAALSDPPVGLKPGEGRGRGRRATARAARAWPSGRARPGDGSR